MMTIDIGALAKKIIVSIVVVLLLLAVTLYDELHACQDNYFFGKIGLGKNIGDEWEDQGSIGGAAFLGYRHKISEVFHGEFSLGHYSQPFVGDPINNDKETSTYNPYYYIEVRIQ